MKVLSKKTLGRIEASLKTKNKLAYEFNVVGRTIENYLNDNNPILTSATALAIIREELNIPESENILEDKK